VWREGDLAGCDLVALTDDPRDPRPHLRQPDPERLEHPRRRSFLLAEQPDEEMLCADVVVLEPRASS